MKKLFQCVLVLLLLTAFQVQAQVSIGIQYGYAGPTEKLDPYAINASWPVTGNSNGDNNNSTVFYGGSTGTSGVATITWEASPHIGVSLVYRMSKFSNSSEGREGSINSLGVQFKVNFVENSKKVVPFFQAEYFFLNTSMMKQTSLTSTTFPNQTSPSFDQTVTTNLGIGGDLGVEIKLSQPFSLVLTGGFHGAQMSNNQGDALFSTLNYGTDGGGNAYAPPQNFDGVFWIQATGGIKYYIGKGKKKRDF